MTKPNQAEAMASGYDSGISLAVWFPCLPTKIKVPLRYEPYREEYLEELNRGFRDRRRKMKYDVHG